MRSRKCCESRFFFLSPSKLIWPAGLKMPRSVLDRFLSGVDTVVVVVPGTYQRL